MKKAATLLVAISLTQAAVFSQSIDYDLYTLANQSTAIVKAKVLSVNRNDNSLCIATFKVTGVIKGNPLDIFHLQEPAHSSCGRPLSQIIAGQSLLVFLKSHRGQTILTANSKKGIFPADAKTLKHLNSLVSTGSKEDLAKVFLEGMESSNRRVWNDSTRSLLLYTDSISLNEEERSLIIHELEKTILNDDPNALNLFRLAQKLSLDEAVGFLAPMYAKESKPEWGNLLFESLPGFNNEKLGKALMPFANSNSKAKQRSIKLLQRCQTNEAKHCLMKFLATDNVQRLTQTKADSSPTPPNLKSIRNHIHN